MSSVSRARLASLVFAVAAVVCAALAPAAAQAATKPYEVEFGPTSLQAGGTTTVTATVTNKTPNQSIGSIQFTAPVGALITSAAPGAGLQSIPSGGAPSVMWLNQNIVLGTPATYTLNVKAPCTKGADPWAWTVEAKQSNNFSGPPGNTFGPQASSSLVAGLAGSCAVTPTVQWKDQPQDARVDRRIGATDYVEPPPAPTVEVTGGGVPLNDVPVTASLVRVTGSGSLASTSTVTARTNASGVAEFTNLKVVSPDPAVSAAGYYKLDATVSGASPVRSEQFLIQAEAVNCATSGCVGSTSGTLGSNLNVSVAPWTGFGAPGFLSLSVLTAQGSPIGPDCHQWYTPFSREFSMVIGPAGQTGGVKTITYQITKADMNSQPNNGAAFIDVCYAQPGPAVNVKGNTGSNPWDADGDGDEDGRAWVLALCKDTGNQPPCEKSTSKDGAGNGKVTWLAPGGADDPLGRG